MKIKNEKQALQMFCSPDTYFRTKLTRPFIDDEFDGKVIATDGYVLLIVDKKLLRCKYETDSQKIPQMSCNRISIPISFAAIDDAYNRLELVPEEVAEDGRDKECLECCGEGQVEFEYNAENGQTYFHYCKCPICDGTGIRDDYVPVKTGRMLVPPGSVFIMHRTYFDARRVWKVVEALRLMGFEQMTWVGESETGMNWFDVCDGLQLVLMPMANTNNFKQEIRIKLEE
jgi:hypothetical protein